ncbi:MAG: helix-turn-helix domain-containing protein [Blastocatellia bacterium]|nr:helix-turn-helix domain-containing protein [Blastocatellia bacterium]
MSVQLALRFDEAPITCATQQRYHSISPCLAGKRSAEEQADALGISYSAVCRWLRRFREEGMPGLFPATQYPREPHPPNMSSWRCFFTRLAPHEPQTGNWRES